MGVRELGDGMACGGDSGGGLVTLTTPPQLIAVVSVGGTTCTPGGPNGYADTTQPEIQRWISGEAQPPRGPRITAVVSPLTAAAFPDGALHCNGGAWSGSPTLRFTFSDDVNGAVAAGRGDAPRTARRAADAGRTIRCVVTASNDGGFTQISPDPLGVPTPWGLTVTGER